MPERPRAERPVHPDRADPPPALPVDKDRDLWYDTEWQPRHPHNWGHWWNSWKDGGLYGQPLTAKCTAVRLPFFRGTPGDTP